VVGLPGGRAGRRGGALALLIPSLCLLAAVPPGEGDWLLVPTAVNRMPAAASYLRRPGESVFSAYKLDVLRVEADRIAEITTFGVSELVRLGVPLVRTP